MSRIFPTQFGPPLTSPTDLDNDDPFLVSRDGFVKPAAQSAVRPLMHPEGYVDANDYTAASGSLINSADALTNWVGTALFSAATIGTVNKTEGTGSVRAILRMQAGITSKIVYTPPTPIAIGAHTLAALDVIIFPDGPVQSNQSHQFEVRVADGAGITAGNISAVSLAGTPYGDPAVANVGWVTIIVPLAGLANITSMGLIRPGTILTGTSSDRVDFRIDNLRFLNETKLDAALSAASSSVAVVPPSYPPDPNQLAPFLPAGKGIIDAAKGVFSKQNNVVWLHDFLAHVVGAETGAINVGPAISRVINQAPPGSTIRATPGAVYRFDNDISLRSLHDLTIDFTGATCVLTYQSNSPFWSFVLCRNIVMMGGTWLGYYRFGMNGSALVNVAGTPTVVSTTKILDAQLEEVKLPDHTNWLRPSHFTRHLPQQLGLPADGGGPRCYWEFLLSDSANVPNDCVISVFDGSTDGTWAGSGALLTSQTLTLTSTPTIYRIEYEPTNLRQRHLVTVKKATATANNITVSSAFPYGENEYNATYDVASCFVLTSSTYITLRDMWIEGFGGDAIQVSDLNVSNLLVQRVVSRGCRRQGMSFNQGSDMIIEDVVCSEVGRSGIDFEPFATNWYTKRVICRNVTFYNIVNYGFAMGNWARNFDYVIDGVDITETRLGMIFGGFTRGVMKNMRNWSALNYGQTNDYDFTGAAMDISHIRTKLGVVLHTSTNAFDDGTGSVTFTPNENIVRSNTFGIVAGTGIAWVAGWRPDTLTDITVAASATSHAVVFNGYTIRNGTYGVRVETNWNSGHPWITAKSNLGFTINFPTAAPADGTGRLSWSWQ